LAGWLTEWLTDWLTNWLPDWLVSWLAQYNIKKKASLEKKKKRTELSKLW